MSHQLYANNIQLYLGISMQNSVASMKQLNRKAEKYKYHGVVYSTKYPKYVLKETFLHLASQAGKTVLFLHKQSRYVVGKLSPAIVFKVFGCQILPILAYASDIWYTGDSVDDLEKCI